MSATVAAQLLPRVGPRVLVVIGTVMAAALVNTTQQVGGSLGTALLNTVAATASYVSAHHGCAAQAAATENAMALN